MVKKSPPILLILLALFVVYAVLGCFGYGNDYDTYAMIKSGRDLFRTGHYHYSRGPGNFVPELIIGGVSLIGGYVLTNLISALLGAGTLYLFWKLLIQKLPEKESLLIVLLLGLNPYFVIASCSSMDYVYALFFAFAGITMLTKDKLFVAAVLFGIAVSCRLTTVAIIGLIYLYFLYIRFRAEDYKDMSRFVFSGILTLILSVMFFVPSYYAANCTFKFMEYGIGNWDLMGVLSRIIYKNIYLFGLIPFLFLGCMLIYSIIKKKFSYPNIALVNTGMAIFIFMELLFFKVPVEISYLLPPYIVFLPLLVVIFKPSIKQLYIFLILTVIYSFVVNPDVLSKTYTADRREAVSAKVGLFIRKGAVVDDVLNRNDSREFYWQE